MGARAVVGRGIRKISFVNSLKRSNAIWNAPLRPINEGPIRRIAYAKTFRSVKTTNSVNKTENKAIIKPLSLITKPYLTS